jgi:large repetitive protein
MAYDSDKVSEQKLFRDLDPNAYYPAYGDDSQRGFDAQSTSRLYLRADHDKSYVLFGDIVPPGATPARNLGAYTRSLTGLRQHYENDVLTVDTFLSRDSTRQMVEEISANGTSGPYLTGSGVMVINSERIEVIVRDRNQSGVILSRTAQARYVDYDIEPLTGRILFRAPVASLDQDLNPVSIRISYEIDQGSPRFWTGGFAAQYKFGKVAEIGGSWIDDRNPAAPTTLSSVNATVRPDDKTTIIVEGAQMEKSGVDGRAARFETVRVDGKLESRVFGGRADLNFDNPSSNLPRGRV